MFLTKLAFASLLAYVPAAPAQQITGRFYPEKEEYLVGEPITVVFEVVNSSAETIEIADGYCPDLHEPLSIANQPPEKKLSLFGCAPPQVIAASCLSSLRDIAPGGTFHRRYLLWEVDSPGIYNVHGTQKQQARSKQTHDLAADLDINSEFDIAVRAPKDGELEAVYQPFLNDLSNRDFLARSFAASAIAQNPPRFAESAILAIADDRMLANASIRGLKRLATPAARAKLVLLSDTSSPEYFRQPAIQALGEIGNPTDCEAVLKIANENKNYTQALAYAAAGRICREKAIPVLLSLVSSADTQLLAGVLHGLGNSSSSSSVPVLINVLQSPDQNVRREASTALETLTHKESRYAVMSDDSAKQAYDEWAGWWFANSSTALIYAPDQCTAPQPLR
jgi:hypothetical protein